MKKLKFKKKLNLNCLKTIKYIIMKKSNKIMNQKNLPFKKIFNKKNLIHKNNYKKLIFLNKKKTIIMI